MQGICACEKYECVGSEVVLATSEHKTDVGLTLLSGPTDLLFFRRVRYRILDQYPCWFYFWTIPPRVITDRGQGAQIYLPSLEPCILAPVPFAWLPLFSNCEISNRHCCVISPLSFFLPFRIPISRSLPLPYHSHPLILSGSPPFL